MSGTLVSFNNTWQPATIDHADTRDLAFVNNVPELLGTDGGLHKTTNGGTTWTYTGGGREGGFNALQVNEVKGQLYGTSQDLYIGTQDNNLWALNIWANVWNLYGAEGFYIEAERRVAAASGAKITYRPCGGCENKISDRHFFNDEPFRNAPGAAAAAPTLLRASQYVQQMPGLGLALTLDTGVSWLPWSVFLEEPRDAARLGQNGQFDPLQRTVVYQPFRRPADPLVPGWPRAAHLLRVEQTPTGNPVTFFPAMNGFGSLGINPTMFPWYQVYGINPRNAFQIIAPDVVSQRMMRTDNGGQDWTEIPGLTSLVTDNGRLLFNTNLIGGPDAVFPVVTAVSFCPDDPRLVLVGTSEGGIYFSGDNGATWKKMAGSELVTYITGFYWTDTNNVYISTYGRGLWKLTNRRITLPDAFDDLCTGNCDVVSNDGGPGRPPFAGGVLVFEGTILGVRTNDRQLREVFITPGTSVLFLGDEADLQEDIVVTESDGKELPPDLEPLPKPPADGWIVRGVVFEKDDTLTGTVFGEGEATLIPMISGEEFKAPTESPNKGTPYIRLVTNDYEGVATTLPGAVFEVAATGFLPAATYEVLVDGVAAKGTYTADGGGAFRVRLTAPADQGYHEVSVRAAGGGGSVLDASTLLVRHED